MTDPIADFRIDAGRAIQHADADAAVTVAQMRQMIDALATLLGVVCTLQTDLGEAVNVAMDQCVFLTGMNTETHTLVRALHQAVAEQGGFDDPDSD